jgi:hypothetical protein
MKTTTGSKAKKTIKYESECKETKIKLKTGNDMQRKTTKLLSTSKMNSNY